MKRKNALFVLVAGILGSVCLVSPNFLRAQAPAGPMPAATPQPTKKAASAHEAQQPPRLQPRQTIAGAWKLNRDESDDPHKKMEEARGASGGGRSGPYGGSGPLGGGWPGGRRGGYGRRGGMGGGESDEDRQRMQELFRPAGSIAIAQKGASEIDLTDDQNRKRVFYTDGRKLQKSKDDKYREIAAHWDDKRLVADEKGPGGRKITRSFELAPDGTQLYESLRIEGGRSGSNLFVRYVYDAAEESKESR